MMSVVPETMEEINNGHCYHQPPPGPTSPKASWLAMNSKVKQTRMMVHLYGAKIPFNFCLWPDSLEFSHNTHNGGEQPSSRAAQKGGRHHHLLFLSVEPGTECTLFSADIPSIDEDQQFHRSLPWVKLIDSTGFPQQPANASKEEALMSERKRCSFWGVNTFQLEAKSGRIIFPANCSLFQTSACGTEGFKEIPSGLSSARLNATMAPGNPDLVAFSSLANLWIYNAATNEEIRLTDNDETPPVFVSAGLPSYIMQEEFNRYTGFYWSPVPEDNGVYHILYEETDETAVESVFIISHDSITEEHKFPKAGGVNSISSLKMIAFKVGYQPQVQSLNFDFREYFPWCEYIVRLGWTPDGKKVWAFLLDRCQKRLEIVVIDRAAFFLQQSESFPRVQVIFREDADTWINVSNIIYFFDNNSSNSIEFIVSSEETGFRHLYFVQAGIGGNIPDADEEVFQSLRLRPQLINKIPLTSGEWPVSYHPIEVDPIRKLVYFHGYRESPTEKHAYVVALSRPCHVRRLTEANYSHSCDFFIAQDMMVTVFSNTKTEPGCLVSKLRFSSDNNVDKIQFQKLGWLLQPRECDMNFPLPKIYNHSISSGDTLYSIMYLPRNLDVRKKYPVVVNVYGGPDFQLVTNTFKGAKYVRNYLLASLGYVVISIDSRGSSNRGKAFESHIYKKLGQLELKDQLEVLEMLAEDFKFIDMTRVGIIGWSYGGYLSLRAIVDHPDTFKVAIAGAPVTDWLMYDTAYTERYMDLPENNPVGYTMGSVLRNASRFPDERDRLLVAHGKLDENVHFQHTERLLAALTRHSKPIRLQVYPTERHSLRHMDVSEHFETTLICFLADHL